MESKQLTQLLSVDRANSYQTWIAVGQCLHNIDSSLLDSWIDFSQRCSKFKEGECEEIWAAMDLRDDGPGLGSLHRWAKMDNPKGYQIFTRNNIATDILKSQSQTTQDVACVVYNMYKYEYKCTSIKNGVWYEFRNHRWCQVDSGYTLRRKIGNEVVNEYLRLITYYNIIAWDQQTDEQIDDYLGKSKNLTDVTYKLRDSDFKENIMNECQTLFYDPQFESKLDVNPDLIGFENGIYDLRNGEFRDGRPDDYISLTTGNDYIELSKNDEVITAIDNFMSQVFPDPDVRTYVLILLASFLEGRNPHEKFHIWTGVGDNGKSKLLELFELAFGKYTAKRNFTFLTRKIKNPDFEFARLKSIRALQIVEQGETESINIGLMKELTGGDRLPYYLPDCDPVYFKPQFKMIYYCKQLPSLPLDDYGVWRRVRVTEFKGRFVNNPDPKNPYEFKKDPYLSQKLFTWKEAFMFILLEHYKIYKKQGLIEPMAVTNATIEYQKMNDISRAYIEFVDDCLEKDANSSIKLEATYEIFKGWWKANFEGKLPTRRDMKAGLEKKLGQYLPNSEGGWHGYKFVVRSNIDL